MNEKKKFGKPVAEKIEFAAEDVILASLGLEDSLDDWDGDGNKDTL